MAKKDKKKEEPKADKGDKKSGGILGRLFGGGGKEKAPATPRGGDSDMDAPTIPPGSDEDVPADMAKTIPPVDRDDMEDALTIPPGGNPFDDPSDARTLPPFNPPKNLKKGAPPP